MADGTAETHRKETTMDPIANLHEQRALAAQLLRPLDFDVEDLRPEDYDLVGGRLADANRLAELVQALDEWRSKGGFDPYATA
jgi:hypothetical protein